MTETASAELVTSALEAAVLTTPDTAQPDLLSTATSQEQATTDPAPPTKPPRASKKKDVSGRALIDIPAHGLKCGDYATLPADVAATLPAGEFDQNAVQPE